MRWLSVLYVIFVGIILTLTTGFGIAAFYPAPLSPVYPTALQKLNMPESCLRTPEQAQTPECLKIQAQQEQDNQKFQEEQRVYQNKYASYTRTTIFFGMTVGAIFTILSLTQIKKSKLIAHGLMLAGVLTMLLNRLTVSLASLGSEIKGTEAINTVGIMEFGVLALLSLLVIFVGLKTFTEEK